MNYIDEYNQEIDRLISVLQSVKTSEQELNLNILNKITKTLIKNGIDRNAVNRLYKSYTIDLQNRVRSE